MRRNIVNSASGLKTAFTIVFSDHDFFIKGLKLWRFDNTVSDFEHIFTAHAQKQLFRNFRSKIYNTNAFPLPSDVYWIYSMFLCQYIAWPCDLDLWPFDLESVSCTVLLMSNPHTNFYYPMTIVYWVTSTEYLITFPLSETVTAHAPCHVTCA